MLQVARIEGHSFLSTHLQARSLVLDFGMNRGRFARSVMDRFGCKVIGLEPSPQLFQALRSSPGLIVEPDALCARDGVDALLYLNDEERASIVNSFADDKTPTTTVRGVSLSSFLERHQVVRADLAKFDIEGAEVEVFETAGEDALLRLRQITIEFHDFADPRLGPRVDRIHERMEGLGFTHVNFTTSNYDVLYVHPELPLSRVDRYWITAQKYVRGAGRRLLSRFDPDFDKDRV